MELVCTCWFSLRDLFLAPARSTTKTIAQSRTCFRTFSSSESQQQVRSSKRISSLASSFLTSLFPTATLPPATRSSPSTTSQVELPTKTLPKHQPQDPLPNQPQDQPWEALCEESQHSVWVVEDCPCIWTADVPRKFRNCHCPPWSKIDTMACFGLELWMGY